MEAPELGSEEEGRAWRGRGQVGVEHHPSHLRLSVSGQDSLGRRRGGLGELQGTPTRLCGVHSSCAVGLTRPGSGSTPWKGRGRCSELLLVTSLLPQRQEATPPPMPLCTVPSLYFPSSSLLQQEPSSPRFSSSSCLTPHPSTAKSPWSYPHSPHTLPVTLSPSVPSSPSAPPPSP